MRACLALVAGLLLASPTALLGQTDAPPQAAEALPDWSGVWIAEGAEPEISGFPGFTGIVPYKLLPGMAPWNEAGRARLEALQATAAGRKAFG